MNQLKRTIVTLHQCGTALHPIAIVQIENTTNFGHLRAVNVTTYQAVNLMQSWRSKNPDPGYSWVDERVADINIKARALRDYKFQIEMRRSRNKK